MIRIIAVSKVFSCDIIIAEDKAEDMLKSIVDFYKSRLEAPNLKVTTSKIQ